MGTVSIPKLTFVLALSFASVSADYGHYSAGHTDEISALNYRLCSTLKANTTYIGVVVNLQPVVVSSYRNGLVPMFITGLIDVLSGSRLSEVQQPANQYTILLDVPLRPNNSKLITVVQGPANPIAVGQPVLMIIERVDYHHVEARLTPLARPPT